MIKIPISSLRAERRDGKTLFTYLDPETKEVRTEEIPISFLKPTERLWDELCEMEKTAETETDEGKKGLLVRQLVHVQIQSTAITEDDGRPYNITADDLKVLDLMQAAQLWIGVKESFFLRTPAKESETTTNSSSALADCSGETPTPGTNPS
jgi:hypothetical protein